MSKSGTTSLSLVFMAIVLLFYILFIWASFFIPFVIALLISLSIISLYSFFKNKNINKYISFFLSVFTFWMIFFLVWYIINSNINDLIDNSEEYQSKFRVLIFSLTENSKYLDLVTNQLKDSIIWNINISKALGWIASALTSIVSYFGIIFFYTIFILLEYRYFWNKVRLILSWISWKDKVSDVIDHIKKDVRSYFVIKALASFATGFLSFILLLSVWIDFAPFWALLIFLLNFIPTIWSIIAVMLVLVFWFIQFGLLVEFTVLLIWLPSVQILIWNIIEPRFMWTKLNLSPLVIILSLWFWGIIWWVVWMLLSVPIMVIINIILSNIETTRPLAILMSEKWDLRTSFWIEKRKRKKILEKLKKKIFKSK